METLDIKILLSERETYWFSIKNELIDIGNKYSMDIQETVYKWSDEANIRANECKRILKIIR